MPEILTRLGVELKRLRIRECGLRILKKELIEDGEAFINQR